MKEEEEEQGEEDSELAWTLTERKEEESRNGGWKEEGEEGREMVAEPVRWKNVRTQERQESARGRREGK